MRWILALPVLCYAVNVLAVESKNFELPMRALLLVPTNDPIAYPALSSARTAFAGQGIHYDEFFTSAIYESGFSIPLPLTDSDGSPKYQAIVLAQGNLVFQEAPNNFVSSLGPRQWADLATYRQQHGARLVSLDTNLMVQPLLNTMYSNCEGGGQAVRVIPDSASIDGGNFTWSGVSAQTAVWDNPTSWSYQCDYVGPLSGMSVQPILRFSSLSSGHASNDPHAAAVYHFPTGEEELHFFFVDSLWAPQSAPLASAWIPWMFRGAFLGIRRMYFLVQMDDLFAPENLWSSELRRTTDAEYRPTVSDMAATIEHQAEWNRLLPNGSKIMLSHPYNGWWAGTTPGTDPLYEYMRDECRDKFFYISHTFQHLNLKSRTYAQAKDDFQKNIDFFNNFFFADGEHLDMHSPTAAVTPQISGLENGDALKAMWDLGIRNLPGDNSIARYRPDNWHHGWYTTTAANGFEGMFIIPRQPTQIYFDCINNTDTESRYNFTNFAQTGPLPLESIIKNDVALMMQGFFHFRHDPFMMHTANIHIFEYQGKNTSLVDLWVTEFVKVYSKKFIFPLLTLKQDELAKTYADRKVRDECGLTGRLIVENCIATKIVLKSTGTCVAALTGVHSNSTGQGVWYGPDYNLMVPMSAAEPEKTLVLDNPIPLPDCSASLSPTTAAGTTDTASMTSTSSSSSMSSTSAEPIATTSDTTTDPKQSSTSSTSSVVVPPIKTTAVSTTSPGSRLFVCLKPFWLLLALMLARL